jgi:alpha-1,3-mannosyltransferase
MNILQVSRSYEPAIGGIETVTRGISRALHQRGHRCDIVTLRYLFDAGMHAPAVEQRDGLNVYRLPHLGSRRYSIAPAVLNFVAPFDVVHIHAIDFFVDMLGASKAYHNKPIVVNTHGGIFHTRWLAQFKKIYFLTMTRLALRRVDTVICDSEHDHQLFRRIVPLEKLHIIRNGVDVTPYQSIIKNVDAGLLVGIGRIFPNKRIDRLIQIVAALAAEHPELRLVWVGNDGEGKTPALMALAQEYGVAERITFTGMLPAQGLYDLLARAHFFVSASDYEAFGISTIEAMASATVPIVSPVGIHPEAVQHEQNGFLWHPDDELGAQHILRHALHLPKAERQLMGQRAAATAQAYSWEQTIEHYVQLYQRCLL